MSKIGKKPIKIPDGVEVKFDGDLILVKGLKGELKKIIPLIFSVEIKNGCVEIGPKDRGVLKEKENGALWGLFRSLIQNMITGVAEGFEKNLEFQGVGFKAVVKGDELEIEAGYSHPIKINAPEGISFKVEKNVIKIMGVDKDLVGRVAADIRSKRKPEPYKGSGIRYQNEVIKKKAGKKAVTTGQ